MTTIAILRLEEELRANDQARAALNGVGAFEGGIVDRVAHLDQLTAEAVELRAAIALLRTAESETARWGPRPTLKLSARLG